MRPNTLLTKARPHIRRYLTAAAFVGVSLFARLLLDDYFQHRFFVHLFYPAVLLTAYCCGLGPSMFAVVLSAIAIRYFFIRPTGQFFGLMGTWEPFRLSIFMAWSSLIASIICQIQTSKKLASKMAWDAIRSRDQLRRDQELLRREQEFLRHLIDHQESEKQMLCNDFHDGIIQNVVGSKMLLEAHLHESPDNSWIYEVIQHLSKGIDDGRRVIRGIRPSVLDEHDLAGLIHELVEHFSAVGFEVNVACSRDCDGSDLSDAIKTAIFRICQEALTNSWKHSGCKKASISIEKMPDCITFEIADEGRGNVIPSRGSRKGFGLEGMDARARMLGGSIDIVGNGKGTRVRVRLPLAVEHIACPTA